MVMTASLAMGLLTKYKTKIDALGNVDDSRVLITLVIATQVVSS